MEIFKNLSKEERVILDIYRDLYKNATPSADFDKLVENAPLNDRKQRVIDFMSYEITMKDMDEIIEQHIKTAKIREGWRKQRIKNTVYLGCSPKTKWDGAEDGK